MRNKKFTHGAVKKKKEKCRAPRRKAGTTVELDSASVARAEGLDVLLTETKSNITCSPWERDGLSALDKTSR